MILVTGVTGTVGSAVVRQLVALTGQPARTFETWAAEKPTRSGSPAGPLRFRLAPGPAPDRERRGT
jgi:uncharacterized protein YbjT (DUF2867 family)